MDLGNVYFNVSIEKWLGAGIDWDNSTQNWKLMGPMSDVIDVLSEKVFRYKLVRSSDHLWGLFNSTNKSWNGMMGLLERNETDIALGPIALTYERSLVSPYTKSLFSDEITTLSAYTNQGVDIFAPISSLIKNKIWMSLFLAFILFNITTSLSLFLKHNRVFDRKSFINIFFANSWILFSLFFTQGSGVKHKTLLTYDRIVLLTISITTVFLTIFYATIIGTSIVIGPELLNIDSIEDIVNRSKIIPTIISGSFEMQMFENSSSGIYRKIRERLDILPPDVFNAHKTKIDVIKGKRVIIGDVIGLYGLAAKMCEYNQMALLYIGKQRFMPTQFVLMTSRRANQLYPTLHKHLDRKVYELYTTGIFNQLLLHTYSHSNRCLIDNRQKSEQDFKSLMDVFIFELSHFNDIINIYFALNVLGFIILIIECCIQIIHCNQE